MSRCVAMSVEAEESCCVQPFKPCHPISNVAAQLYVTPLGLEQWGSLAVDF